ncbi:UNVERIFIED_CONTAM: hypothetical protein RMT77_006193 [Armadillidium vulgare]|nr:hypothetical protein Avbf_10226 [Armadillidium vulgare]
MVDRATTIQPVGNKNQISPSNEFPYHGNGQPPPTGWGYQQQQQQRRRDGCCGDGCFICCIPIPICIPCDCCCDCDCLDCLSCDLCCCW